MAVPIGGLLANSFLSRIVFVPYAGNTSFTPLRSLSGASGQFSFDVVTAQPKIIRHLDNATTTGLWFHRGRRQTARDAEMAMRLKWNISTPPDALIGFYQSLYGYQVFATIGSNAQTNNPDLQYYWLPSTFVAPETVFIDVGSTPPKLIEIDILLEPNSPAFYVDDGAGATYDSAAITAWTTYINARGEGF